MNDYLKFAKKQFIELKKDSLDDDNEYVGAENEVDYEENGEKFKIKIVGFRESSDWFEYIVSDEQNNIIISDDFVL